MFTEDADGKCDVVAVEGKDSKVVLTAMLRYVVVQQLHVYTGYWRYIEDVPIHAETFLKIDCMRLNIETPVNPHTAVTLLQRFRNIKVTFRLRVIWASGPGRTH